MKKKKEEKLEEIGAEKGLKKNLCDARLLQHTTTQKYHTVIKPLLLLLLMSMHSHRWAFFRCYFFFFSAPFCSVDKINDGDTLRTPINSSNL